jgi:RimJ/RimL family protein N-acetyltransferase
MNTMIDHARSRASPPGEPVRLKDGTLCHIRPIGRDDPELVTACFDGLSDASRRLRFFGAKRALTDAELAYLSGADGHDHLAFAAVRRDALGRDTAVLGTARCIRSTPGSETAELAMAVVDRAQGNGVGTALLDHLIEAAREQGIRRFRCEVLADNEGMRALAKRLGGHPGWLDDGTLEYDCALPDAPAAPKPNPKRASRRRPAPGSVSWRTARPVPAPWTDSWERAAKVSVAFFETAALTWYDNVLPGQFGR